MNIWRYFLKYLSIYISTSQENKSSEIGQTSEITSEVNAIKYYDYIMRNSLHNQNITENAFISPLFYVKNNISSKIYELKSNVNITNSSMEHKKIIYPKFYYELYNEKNVKVHIYTNQPTVLENNKFSQNLYLENYFIRMREIESTVKFCYFEKIIDLTINEQLKKTNDIQIIKELKKIRQKALKSLNADTKSISIEFVPRVSAVSLDFVYTDYYTFFAMTN